MPTATETANKVLDHMKQRDWTWYNTIPMMLKLEIKDNTGNRQAFRRILDRLADAGKLQKHGQGKFKWKLLVDSWDRSNPFAAEPGHTPRPTGMSPILQRLVDNADDDDTPPVADHEEDTPSRDGVLMGEQIRELRRELEIVKDKAEDDAEKLRKELAEIRAAEGRSVKLLKIERYDGKVTKLHNVVLPAYFDQALALAKARRNILLIGPAGCGKSTIAEILAKTLGLKFGKVGGSGGLQEVHLLGRSNPNLSKGTSTYSSTDFVDCYEGGGLCLVDELDGADPNVLLALNPALDRSGLLPLPGRPSKPAKRDKDFVCVATANTIGRGATRQYYGRNQLDEATLDRFRIGTIECDYDPVVEAAVCPDDELRKCLQDIREKVIQGGVRRIISTRFLEDAYIMQQTAKWSVEFITQKVLMAGWSADERAKIGGAY